MFKYVVLTLACGVFSFASAQEIEQRIYVERNAVVETESGEFVLCLEDKIVPISVLYADASGYYVVVGRYASWTCRRCHTHNSYVEKCSNPTCGCPRLFCDPDVVHAQCVK